MPFDFHARYGLLTYAQCGDLDPFAVCGHLGQLGAECIIGKEAHADGGIHLHAFFDFGQKRRFRRADVFDVHGHHPNIEKSRGTPEVGYDYAIKEGEIVAGGLERPIPPEGGAVRGSSNHWHLIVAAETREQFWELCRTYAPRVLCTSFSNLQRYADYTYATKPAVYTSPNGTFDLDDYGGLQRWSDENVGSLGGARGKCGRSGVPAASCLPSRDLSDKRRS